VRASLSQGLDAPYTSIIHQCRISTVERSTAQPVCSACIQLTKQAAADETWPWSSDPLLGRWAGLVHAGRNGCEKGQATA
jgi:hypothetical protein